MNPRIGDKNLDFLKLSVPRDLAFNPDEPRGEDGKWTDGGGNESAPEAQLSADESDAAVMAVESHTAFLDEIQDTVDNDSGRTADDYQEMLDALSDYSGDGYVRMNSLLRREPDAMDQEFDTHDDDEEDDDGDRRPSVKSDIQKMQKLQELIDESPSFKESITVYRGVDGDLKASKGDTIQLNGFQSTSFDPNVAASFTSDGHTLLRIKTKEGLILGGQSRGGEQEVILSHGRKYTVLSSKKVKLGTKGTVTLIELEQK